MRVFSHPEVDQNYRRIGFRDADLFLKLTVGNVSVYAAEHPFKGVSLTLESFTSRSIGQFQVSLPGRCTAEQIAGLIYANIALNFRDSAPTWKAYFEDIGIPLFQ